MYKTNRKSHVLFLLPSVFLMMWNEFHIYIYIYIYIYILYMYHISYFTNDIHNAHQNDIVIAFTGINKVLLYCIVLYSIILFCVVLYCIVLYCIVLYCIVLYCIVLYCGMLWFMHVNLMSFSSGGGRTNNNSWLGHQGYYPTTSTTVSTSCIPAMVAGQRRQYDCRPRVMLLSG